MKDAGPVSLPEDIQKEMNAIVKSADRKLIG